MKIGMYEIKKVDKENYTVTKEYGSGTVHTAKLCGGDFESLLSCLFIDPELTYDSSFSTVKSSKSTTYKQKEYF